MDTDKTTNIFFTLNSANDLFEKCKYEYLDILDVNHNNAIYMLFNLILSLNHLLEWFLTDETININLKKQSIKHFYPYREKGNETRIIRDFIVSNNLRNYDFEINKNQELIRLVSNRLKHIKSKKINTSVNTSFTVTCDDDIYCGDDKQCGDYKYTYYVNYENIENDISIIIDVLLNDWNSFFNNT